MKRYFGLILTLLLMATTPVFAATKEITGPEPIPIKVTVNATKTITFEKVVFRVMPNVYEGSPEFVLEANELLKANGYNVQGGDNPLFVEKEQDKANLLLGCIVKNITYEKHGIFGKYVKVSLATEWQLYDALQKKIIYRTQTTGMGISKAPTVQPLFAAFCNGLKQLMAQKEFVAVVSNGSLTHNPVTKNADPALPLTVALPKNTKQLNLPGDINRVLDSVVMIRVGSILGSGVFISNDGYLLTAAHVVTGVSEVNVTLRSGIVLLAQVIRVDPHQDVALIKVAGSGYSALKLALNSNPAVGSTIYVVGTPADEEFSNSVSKGIVSGIRKIDDTSYIQTDASLSPGCSGGPMVNAQGKIVAITSWKIVAQGFEGLAFGVPITTIKNSLNLALN